MIQSKIDYKTFTILASQENKECPLCAGVMIKNTLANKMDHHWFCTKCIYREEVKRPRQKP